MQMDANELYNYFWVARLLSGHNDRASQVLFVIEARLFAAIYL